jgi:hypothetical protein
VRRNVTQTSGNLTDKQSVSLIRYLASSVDGGDGAEFKPEYFEIE